MAGETGKNQGGRFSFRRRLSLWLGAAIVLSVALCTLLTYRLVLPFLAREYGDKLKTIAVTAAHEIDAEAFARLRTPAQMDSPDYHRMRDQLRALRQANAHLDIRFLYTMAEFAPGEWRFVVDTELEHTRDFSPLGMVDELEADDPVRRAAATGEAAIDRDVRHYPRWGALLSVAAPIRAADGRIVGVVGVDAPARAMGDARATLLNTALVCLGVGLIYAVMASFSLGWQASRPVAALFDSEERYRTAVASFPRGSVVLFDRDLRCTIAGGENLAVVGLPAERLVGKTMFESLPPELIDLLEAPCRAALAGQMRAFELQVAGRVFEMRTVPVRGVDGQIEQAMAVSRDITEAHRWSRLERLRHEANARVFTGGGAREALEGLCAGLTEVFGAALVMVATPREDGPLLEVLAHAGPAAGYALEFAGSPAAAEGPAVAAFRKGVPVNTLGEPEQFAAWRGQAAAHGVGEGLAFPLAGPKGAIGALALYVPPGGAFDPDAADWLRGLATHVAVLLLVAREQQELRLQGVALNSAANAIFITDREGRIQWVNQAFTRMSGYAREEVVGQTPRILRSGRQGEDYYGALWETILAGRPFQGEATDRRKDGSPYVVDQRITPLVDGDGQITHFVAIQEDITARREAEERVRFLAEHDVLTGLPNRAFFHDRLEQAVREARRDGSSVVLLMLDLDDFKAVNDTLGHEYGDRLLQQIAERARGCIRESDTLARLGGDEFTLILPGSAGVAAGARVAEKLLLALRTAVDLGGREVWVTPSIGISVFPHDASDVESLLRNADTAMYRAKQEGRNSYRFFTPELQEQAQDRSAIESGLRRALEAGELELYYHPVLALGDGSLRGLEALLRWRHPDLGLTSPERFIAAAEEVGLINRVGEWVLGEACRQAAEWRAAGLPAVPVSVNIAARQLRTQDLPALVERALTAAALPADALVLEITEAAFAEDDAFVDRWLTAFRGLGVRLLVDDFGTGRSSLARLAELRVDGLKVDRRFVSRLGQDPGAEPLVRTILAVARLLGLRAVAEGVETAEQLAFLRSEGCAEAQGFLWHRPLPAAEAGALLAQQAGPA